MGGWCIEIDNSSIMMGRWCTRWLAPGRGATQRIEQPKQHVQDRPEFGFQGRPHLAGDSVAVGVGYCGGGIGWLLMLKNLQKCHHPLVEVRILGEQPLDFAIAQIGDVMGAGYRVPCFRSAARSLIGVALTVNHGEGRHSASRPSRFAQGHHNLFHRRIALGSIHHGTSIDAAALRFR